LELDDIDLSVSFAGHSFTAPLMISAMTGGTEEAGPVNRALARVAEKLGIGFCLGSQRAMMESPELTGTYQVRSEAQDVFLAGNLGGVQAARIGTDKIRGMLEQVEADALCIHLNPAHELAQEEGDCDFRGILSAIGRLVEELDLPVIVKETGCGISREAAAQLRERGVEYLDVAGCGGTSWTGIEIARRKMESDEELNSFRDWGIPTGASLLEADGMGFHLISSGGIRTGLDVARSIALGAGMAGMAAPVLRAYFERGEEGAASYLLSVKEGLAAAMLLTGCETVAQLREVPHVLTGELLAWKRQREHRS